MQFARQPVAGPLRVVPVEIPNSVDPAALRRVLAPDLPGNSGAARELVSSGVAKAEAEAMTEVRNALAGVAGMQVLGAQAADDVQIRNFDKILPQAASDLRRASGADALLRFRITDYGETPKTWEKWVIRWEVVSTLAIAGFIYAVPKTRPLAGIYLVEESIEETVEAYSGFWALDKLCRPVRIEAQLIDLRTGDVVWAESNTGLAKVRLGRLFADVDAATRVAQLESATHASARDLIDRLAESLSPPGASAGKQRYP